MHSLQPTPSGVPSPRFPPAIHPMTETTTATPAAEAPTSLWEDFIDIFYAPREVYARRSQARFGIVLLILTLLVTALFFASQGPLADAFAAEMRRAIERGPGGGQQMNAEQMATARRMGAIFGTLGLLVFFPVGVMVTGLVLWSVGKLFDFAATVGLAILIVTYAQFPRILQSVTGLLQGIFLDPDSLAAISVGPARFFDPATASPALMAMLMRADTFFIWSTILIAIGAQVIGKVPKAQSYVLAVLVWLVGAIPTVVPALFV